MHPVDYLRKTSHRWHQAILAFLDREWEEPTVDQWYLAQIAAETYCAGSGNRESANPKDWLLQFERKKPTVPETAEEAAERSKAGWGHLISMASTEET